MRRLRVMPYFVLAILLCQCAKTDKAGKGEQSEPNGQVSFNDFFERFSKDAEYQTANISFPLPYYSYDIEDQLSESVIQKGEWEFVDFSQDGEAKNNGVDAYEVVVDEVSDREVRYIRKGVDNGIRVEYHFQREGSKWSLSKIENKSV